MDERYEGSAEGLASYFLSGEGLRHIERHIEVQTHDHGAGDGTSTSVREFEHRGHRARIETTYRITIDGQPLVGHVEVLPSGQVHYHRFPQYAPPSAVDVVKAVIDTLWEKPPVRDELAEDRPGPADPGQHGPGDGHHGEADHPEHGHHMDDEAHR
ncbi:MAG: hypothetical protein ACJ73E_14600 [Mycobacteriales bacterium]